MSDYHVKKISLALYIGFGFSYVFVCVYSALRRKKIKVINETVSQLTIWKDIPISDLLRRVAENHLMSFTSLFSNVVLAQTYGIAN